MNGGEQIREACEREGARRRWARQTPAGPQVRWFAPRSRVI